MNSERSNEYNTTAGSIDDKNEGINPIHGQMRPSENGWKNSNIIIEEISMDLITSLERDINKGINNKSRVHRFIMYTSGPIAH